MKKAMTDAPECNSTPQRHWGLYSLAVGVLSFMVALATVDTALFLAISTFAVGLLVANGIFAHVDSLTSIFLKHTAAALGVALTVDAAYLLWLHFQQST